MLSVHIFPHIHLLPQQIRHDWKHKRRCDFESRCGKYKIFASRKKTKSAIHQERVAHSPRRHTGRRLTISGPWLTGPVSVWAGMKPAQIQNSNLNSKK